MVLKSSSRLVASTCPLFHVVSAHVLPRAPSCTCRGSRKAQESHLSSASLGRSYATVSSSQDDFKRGTKHANHPWPSHTNPTPYDIFAIDPSSPYTKAPFYHLVKLYHPDRHHYQQVPSATAPDGLSAAVRLERYRLVVLANDILSDPQKRKAYDSYGAGWVNSHRNVHDLYRQADRSWRHQPGNAAGNATWEDWERWHEARDGKERQDPVFMSNTYFVAIVLASIAIGSAMQASRAANSASHVLDQRTAQELAISDALRHRDQAAAGSGRHDRIEKFIRERENCKFEFSPGKYENTVQNLNNSK